MGLYRLFSCNVEIQYKGCLLSKAMLFTLLTTILTIVLPFFIAHRSRGFWLRTHYFYEQPEVYFTYNYLLVAETADPSLPIVCGDLASTLYNNGDIGEENCVEIQVNEDDTNGDWKTDVLNFKFKLNIPNNRPIGSLIIILALDFKLKTICPMQMQSLAIINKEFSLPSSGFKFQGDLEFYQTTQLPCINNVVDTKYNTSLLKYLTDDNQNLIDSILKTYHQREVFTTIKTFDSRSVIGHTGLMDITAQIRVPLVRVQYTPSILQELKWAWPQYLSLVIIFQWVFNKIRRFVFNNRLLMAWKTVPWKRD